MNKSLRIKTIAIILLTITCPILPNNPPSYWQMFITFICGNPQQSQENPDQAPTGITIDDYIAQLRSDLNGQTNLRESVIPAHEMHEIEAALKINLRNTDLRNKDITNQVIRSVLMNQARIGTIRDLDALAHEGFYISKEEYKTIPTSYENNIRVRLESIPHNLNGAAIAQYFGQNRKNEIRDTLRNRTSYR